MGTKHDTESDTGNGLVSVAQERAENGFGKPSVTAKKKSRKKRVLTAWPERDYWVKVLIDFGLTKEQIALVSEAWPQPIGDTSNVYRLLERRKLLKRYDRMVHKRVSKHSKDLIKCFMRLISFMFLRTTAITDVFREVRHGSVIPDFGFKVGKRQFFCEAQVSRAGMVHWQERMQGYLDLYLKKKEPFRVLFIIAGDLDGPRAVANEVMQDRPNLNLFLFLSYKEFEERIDLVHGKLWITTKGQRVALVE